MNRQQRTAVRNMVTAVTQSSFTSTIKDLINDFKSWQNPDDLALLIGPLPITIGMLKSIPNWESDACIIYNVCASYSGRLMRMAMTSLDAMPEEGSIEDEKLILELCAYTDTLEFAATTQICGLMAVNAYKADENKAIERIIGIIMQGQTKH